MTDPPRRHADPPLSLEVRPGRWAVCRVAPTAPIPEWAADIGTEQSFISITRTDRELSIVAPDDLIPSGDAVERDWIMLRVVGPLAFELVGILARLTGALADSSVSVFAISTYDTDYLLIKRTDAERAIETLRNVATIVGDLTLTKV